MIFFFILLAFQLEKNKLEDPGRLVKNIHSGKEKCVVKDTPQVYDVVDDDTKVQ